MGLMTFILYYNSVPTFRCFIHFGEFYSQDLRRKTHVLPDILNTIWAGRL